MISETRKKYYIVKTTGGRFEKHLGYQKAQLSSPHANNLLILMNEQELDLKEAKTLVKEAAKIGINSKIYEVVVIKEVNELHVVQTNSSHERQENDK